MRTPFVTAIIAAILSCSLAFADVASASETEDVAAASAVFKRNLDAIRHRDRDAYVSTYWQSENLARTGWTGPVLGYEGLEASAGSGWPDVFEGLDLRLVPIRPGVVYGTYRYRVRFGEAEQSGISERFFIETELGWKIAVTTAFQAPPGTPPTPRALVGATLVDGRGGEPLRDSVILMRNGEIECAGPRETCEVPQGVDVIDVSGKWVTPGIVDAHVHFSQTGWADGRPDSIDVREAWPYEAAEAELRENPERLFQSFLCSGVTAVFDVGGYPWTIALPERADQSDRAPHVAAAGPLISTMDHWLNLPGERQFLYASNDETVRNDVRYLASRGSDAIKVWYIALESRDREEMEKAVMAAGDEARTHDLPLIVHATELDTAKAALRAGATLLVHSVWNQPVDDELIDLIRKNDAIYCPTLTVIRGYQLMHEAAFAGLAPAIDDPNGCVSPWVRERVEATSSTKTPATADRIETQARTMAERERIMAANLKRLAAAGVTIAMGTDAGNPLTLHGPSVYAEMEAMQAAGMTPMQVLVASTRDGALAMRQANRIGTIEKGKVADLLVLERDPTTDIAHMRSVRLVVRGGVVRTVEELGNRGAGQGAGSR